MKKKILAVLLTAAMVATMTACGGGSSEKETEAPAESTEQTGDDAEAPAEGADAEAEAPAADAADLKIGLITDVGGVNDGSFNQSAWEGLQRAISELGVEANYLESKTDADYNPNIEAFVDEDYDLIICVGYMLADATRAAAEANPDVKFAIIDDATIELDNVSCLMFKQEQASYLVGYVAGLMTEKDNIGFVIGMANENMNLFGYGYCAGALDANPDVKIQQINANSFAEPATGKTSATTEITNGADIIFHAAGGTGLGVIEACQEAEGVYAIGVDSDQSSLAPDTIITSAMKRVDNAVYDSVQALINGTLEGGVHTYDLAAGGVDIAPTQDLLPDEVVKAVEDVKTKIISGEVTVPSTQAEFEAAYGDVYELD
jgi:basic membrane protein A